MYAMHVLLLTVKVAIRTMYVAHVQPPTICTTMPAICVQWLIVSNANKIMYAHHAPIPTFPRTVELLANVQMLVIMLSILCVSVQVVLPNIMDIVLLVLYPLVLYANKIMYVLPVQVHLYLSIMELTVDVPKDSY